MTYMPGAGEVRKERGDSGYERSPILPRPFATPLSWLATPTHSRLLATALNRVLGRQLDDGELDFLEERMEK